MTERENGISEERETKCSEERLLCSFSFFFLSFSGAAKLCSISTSCETGERSQIKIMTHSSRLEEKRLHYLES